MDELLTIPQEESRQAGFDVKISRLFADFVGLDPYQNDDQQISGYDAGSCKANHWKRSMNWGGHGCLCIHTARHIVSQQLLRAVKPELTLGLTKQDVDQRRHIRNTALVSQLG